MKNILLVDDNNALLFAFKKLSLSYDFAIETANSTEVAMQLLLEQQFDVLICDLNMTGIATFEGYQIVKKAKSLYPGIRAFIWTAYDGEIERKEAIRIGVEGFLTKPVTFDTLLSVIDINSQQQKIPVHGSD